MWLPQAASGGSFVGGSGVSDFVFAVYQCIIMFAREIPTEISSVHDVLHGAAHSAVTDSTRFAGATARHA